MKKIIKITERDLHRIVRKVISESSDDISPDLYRRFDKYMKHYQKFTSENGDIYLHKPGAEYAEFLIDNYAKYCWVDFFYEFKQICDIFSLEEIDAKKLISRWVEDTFKLKGIYTVLDYFPDDYLLKIPSN